MSLKYEGEEQRQITPEEFLAERKSAMRRRARWAVGLGLLAVVANVALVWARLNLYPEYLAGTDAAAQLSFFSQLFRSILFLLGLFFVVAGLWGFYEARRLTLEDLIPTPEAITFLQQAQEIKPYFSYIFIGCLIVVTLFQLKAENVESYLDMGEQSARIAGLVKPLVWQGEWWRLLTYATLHGIFPLHLYFNAQAFYGFGSLIEVLSNRAHLSIVFLLAIIGGGILSLFFMPEVTSIGASGGIMGLIGYLAIYGHRRKRQLPPDFLRSMLVNVGFVAAFGLVAYQIVDNFAHLGGLLTGAIYGFLQIPRDPHKNPRAVGVLTEALGLIALGVFIFVSILSILLILQVVKF
jgi:membrane associated rhomboid family serine protease